jgi:thiol:disulfide interchange protein
MFMQKITTKVLIIIAIVALVYFGNKGVQTYLGKQAVNDLPFTIHTLEEATALAREEGKLVLADYSAIWCPSCRKLDEQVFSNEQVANNIQANFIYTRLDYDSTEGAVFAKKHNLVGFPRVLVLDTFGERLDELPLTFDSSEYTRNLSKAAAAYSQ